MSRPLSEADIIFPHLSNTPNLSSTLASLRRSTLSTHNRLASIISDSDFVTSVASAYELPLVANERCGSWYIPPSQKSGSVYFKSTDGHMGEWSFSLRRLNLQLIDVVEKWGGAVVVDSTRRGKSMPDALSKTIPTWCCVINRAVFGKEKTEEEMALFTPPQAVGESEHAQMEKRIDGFVQQFLDICKPNIPLLRGKLQKPLRPIWVTQQSTLPDLAPSFTEFYPIVLCTASRRVRGAEASESGYIQGAADDHEAWCQGLTPPVFWKHKDLLMSTSEEDAANVITKLLSEEKNSGATASLIKPTSQLYISSSNGVKLNGFDTVVSCTSSPLPPSALKDSGVKHYLHLACQTGKLGSRDLRTQLPQLLPFFSSQAAASEGAKTLVCCPTGKDLSVGVALAILCLYTAEDGAMDTSSPKQSKEMGKAFIKQRLSWITTSDPALNPSRATLQSVNAMLLESQDPKAYLATPAKKSNVIKTDLPIRETRPVAREPQDPPPGPRSIPKAIFENMCSVSEGAEWKFTRTLSSALPTHPSGSVTGTATFTPCIIHPNPHSPYTSSSPSPPSTPTLLYAEEGEFTTQNGMKFTARRKYVYKLIPPLSTACEGGGGPESIAVHFFDDDKMRQASVHEGVGPNGEGIGGLFVEMGDVDVSAEGGVVKAKNREKHLCAEDLYAASWVFGEGMLGTVGRGKDEEKDEDSEVWWEVRYDVKGPQKDYVSTTRYTRV